MNASNANLRRRRLLLAGKIAAPLLLAGAAGLLGGCERPPVETRQIGFRGVAMEDVQNPRLAAAKLDANAIPAALPAVPDGGPTAGATYQNVKVLGDVNVANFTRLMVAMTNWVAPKDGCVYCHNPANFASDDKYAKVVARRMLQMTQHINADWKAHVAATGVTCYTCHRGQPVPAYIWHTQPDLSGARFAGNRASQNAPSPEVAYASLPNDPFTAYLSGEDNIRIEGTTALPTGNRSSIKQGEWTYGLMMHFAQSLGVNCTYCHNTRQFASWPESPPTRAKAWYGIRMVRDLNNDYLTPLTAVFPPERHGPAGDGPKLYCATCHQGAPKPLYGASMLGDYPVLAAPTASTATPAPVAPETPAPASPSAAVPSTKPAA